MKLGTKISAGYAGLVAIAILLGGTAVWKMTAVKTVATQLERERVPEVAVANNVERWSLQTMYQMRGYNYTEETKYLEEGRKCLGEVKKHLAEAKSTGRVPSGSPISRMLRKRLRRRRWNMKNWPMRRCL